MPSESSVRFGFQPKTIEKITDSSINRKISLICNILAGALQSFSSAQKKATTVRSIEVFISSFEF
jgi:hypothetical protein